MFIPILLFANSAVSQQTNSAEDYSVYLEEIRYLATYPESPHAFNYFPTGMAAAANKKMCDWIIALCGE